MAKLTKAQHAVLERMATGDEVWTVSPPNPSTFWHGDMNARAPSFATLHVLWKRGAIEDGEAERGRGHKYRITPAGRAALEPSDER
ncbi:hypothetical protein [Bosea sp. UNC402CLCol]|uniref:hypothetical protein n=1 Tax=Bosea sp. UNC402CLCol TaxID=1510531 RepID=UPI00056F9A4F|nr:hypothetical protein [Bosea sp. UNC402CLCol]